MLNARELKFGEFFDLDRWLLGSGNWPEATSRGGLGRRSQVRVAKFCCLPSALQGDLSLAQAGQVVTDGILGVQAEMFGIRADESAIEHTPGEAIEVLFLDGLQHTRVDLGDAGNVVKRELLFLARIAEFVSEFTHCGRPFLCGGNIIGQPARVCYGD